MPKPAHLLRLLTLFLLGLTQFAACAAPVVSVTPTPAPPAMATPAAPAISAPITPDTATLATSAPAPATVAPSGPAPRIGAISADRASLGRYERIELTVELTATFDQPYDSQQIALSASMEAPSGAVWEIPGFWDGRDSWRVRFTPSETGAWRYTVRVRDPKLSPRYLVYHDGTPFYGVGHCEAFTLADARTDANGDLNILKRMRANGEFADGQGAGQPEPSAARPLYAVHLEQPGRAVGRADHPAGRQSCAPAPSLALT
jgi:hypothetical protein